MDSTRSSLLLRLRDNADQAGWAEFFALYEPFLRNVARKAGLQDQDVDDVAGEVLAKCLEALPTFELDRQRGFFRGWLKTVVQNKVRDLWRRRQRVAVDLEAVQEPAVHDALWDDWERSHQQRVVEFALAEIRRDAVPNTWTCFEQHILQGRAAADVAAELGMKVNAVYANASRTLGRVREKCREYDEELAHA